MVVINSNTVEHYEVECSNNGEVLWSDAHDSAELTVQS